MKKLLLNIQLFANPLLPTNGTHELQERYAQTIKNLFRLKNNLRQFAGTDYDGDPKAGAVKVPVRDTEVAIADYDVVSGTALTTGATEYLTITVDKNKVINELIDGYEAAAVPDNLVAQRLDSGAYKMQRQGELDFISAITDSLVANDAGGGTSTPANPTYATSVVQLTNSTAYNAISNTIGAMIDDGVDVNDIYVAISTETETVLLEDIKYTNTASEKGSERAENGIVNEIRGADVVRSSNLGLVSATGANVAFNGNTVEYVVFSPLWAVKGDEWMVMPQINDLKDGAHIGASALQGREVYWNALTDSRGARVKTRTT